MPPPHDEQAKAPQTVGGASAIYQKAALHKGCIAELYCRRGSRQTSAGVALDETRLAPRRQFISAQRKGHPEADAANGSHSESSRLRMAMVRATIRGS